LFHSIAGENVMGTSTSQTVVSTISPTVILFVAGKDVLKVLGHETLAVSKIASACEKSARTGQSVELTWGPDDLPPK
jgi:hypothetical protein